MSSLSIVLEKLAKFFRGLVSWHSRYIVCAVVVADVI